MSQNVKYHAEIRKWNTEKLINVLNMNGLSDCCDALQTLQIDGDTFLNLSEYQLAFWRKYLNNVQIRRFWSVIQLARERPKDFAGDVIQINNSLNVQQEIERIRSPIVHSLENILGPKQQQQQQQHEDDLEQYENNETIMQVQGKLAYEKLPPKPKHQQQQNNIQEDYLSMKPTENEKQIFHNRFDSKPVQHVHPILQNPQINVSRHDKPTSNSFLHSHANATSSNNESNDFSSSSSTTTTTTTNIDLNRMRKTSSPTSRPLPVPPPLEENVFPLPPNVVPKLYFQNEAGFSDDGGFLPGFSDEGSPIYDDVDEGYKTQPWYTDVNRKEASDLLRGKPNGTFLARPSKRTDTECSLSIIYDHRVYNLAIIKREHKLIIGNQEFDSVTEIIEFFMVNPMVLNGHNNEDIYAILRRI